jgi:translation elongation factor EF-1alpha
MTARPRPDSFAFDALLHQQEHKDLLRFVACGSVDHGKSTLIGRLLYEAKVLFDDQLSTLKRNPASTARSARSPIFRYCWMVSRPSASRRSP